MKNRSWMTFIFPMVAEPPQFSGVTNFSFFFGLFLFVVDANEEKATDGGSLRLRHLRQNNPKLKSPIRLRFHPSYKYPKLGMEKLLNCLYTELIVLKVSIRYRYIFCHTVIFSMVYEKKIGIPY